MGKKGKVIRIGTVKYPVHPGRREKRAPLFAGPVRFCVNLREDADTAGSMYKLRPAGRRRVGASYLARSSGSTGRVTFASDRVRVSQAAILTAWGPVLSSIWCPEYCWIQCGVRSLFFTPPLPSFSPSLRMLQIGCSSDQPFASAERGRGDPNA